MPVSTLPILGALLAAFAAPHPAHPVTAKEVRREIVRLHARVLHVRDARGRIDIRVRRARLAGPLPRLLAEEHHWQVALRRMRRARALWRTPRWSDWMCIHSHEAAWNDPNAPYWGGLQMDMGFQRAYGPDMVLRYGTANRWPIAAQVAVAERAYHRRGFEPWPNTARACGLL
jgi:hypothetical protein